MGGIRLGGSTVLPPVCSPPWTALGAGGSDPQVFAACVGDAPAVATQYTDFSGFAFADQCHNPLLSPDGSKILFEVASSITGYREVWVVDAVVGSTPTQLVADASNYVFHPAWGPDSDTFVYVHGAGGATTGGTVYKDTVSAPGSPVSLKAASGGFSPYRPQFNFDGSRVAYIWDGDAVATAHLRCMDNDGSNDTLLDNSLGGYLFNDPPQFSWANTQDLIVYTTDTSVNPVYVIDDTGSGRTQINSVGDAAGLHAVLSEKAWPEDDSFVVITANLGAGFYSIVRAEIDGSDTTDLGVSPGAVNQARFRGALVFEGRIWFISATDGSASKGRVSSILTDGSDPRVDFDTSAGTSNADPFTGGDGWYFN